MVKKVVVVALQGAKSSGEGVQKCKIRRTVLSSSWSGGVNVVLDVYLAILFRCTILLK